MASSIENSPTHEMLVVGPYGVLGTGVIDAALRGPDWGVVTAARRPPPGYHFVGREAPRHVGIDLLDRPSAMAALSALDRVTDLVFAAYVEGETMAAAVEPNRQMMANTLRRFSRQPGPAADDSCQSCGWPWARPESSRSSAARRFGMVPHALMASCKHHPSKMSTPSVTVTVVAPTMRQGAIGWG